ncbi:MAG: PepSY-associated TM helix domain-containing protein [Alphaproteobacteria bacterium]|nr:PepSY-associated TM helix domain-containing protein [Alphaproteobacteria bacterium]MBU1515885.1 PepSY-associated TM helix domain-containing protein [Alphaproteobacteria bacterium]MBU2094107.1 PepSY-associated TM helix domain-containing protein [Alphaproteobacteria bacterium]MBU2151459.1 PepSY-associated TM helix domain-containing protein [Alphaproteobacteria bacterium]MBU2305265.1 PepSY-associated TM helix domain-containing protein [Alphaproteobacteria bacterium]
MKADAKPKPARKPINWKVEIYKQSRAWHGYLSAFAFMALIFFSITGLLLNHPEWMTTTKEQPSKETAVTLAAAELATAKAAKDPSKALAQAVGAKTPLIGAYQSGEVIDEEAMLRLEGPKGSSDVVVDLATGKAEVTVKRARLIDTINELHRGKNASLAWKTVIDASAIIIILLSVIGYVLFFSLRFRLRTSLILTGVSLAGLIGIVVFFTP